MHGVDVPVFGTFFLIIDGNQQREKQYLIIFIPYTATLNLSLFSGA
jgi:hypothetical protein